MLAHGLGQTALQLIGRVLARHPGDEVVRSVLSSIEAEYRRYKTVAESAMLQLSDAEVGAAGPSDANSVAIIAWHIGGNLSSRFTEFLATDGEKPWRMREEEFTSRTVTRKELADHWEKGWKALFNTLSSLTDERLDGVVTIRHVELSVAEALHRSLAHVSYHVGQIVFLARALRGREWQYLSIPPGGSEAYNQDPTREHAGEHTSHLGGAIPGESEAG